MMGGKEKQEKDVEAGDVVAAKFSDEENYYRAKIVSVEENSYDYDQSTVELFFVDYGDSDTGRLQIILKLCYTRRKLSNFS